MFNITMLSDDFTSVCGKLQYLYQELFMLFIIKKRLFYMFY